MSRLHIERKVMQVSFTSTLRLFGGDIVILDLTMTYLHHDCKSTYWVIAFDTHFIVIWITRTHLAPLNFSLPFLTFIPFLDVLFGFTLFIYSGTNDSFSIQYCEFFLRCIAINPYYYFCVKYSFDFILRSFLLRWLPKWTASRRLWKYLNEFRQNYIQRVRV